MGGWANYPRCGRKEAKNVRKVTRHARMVDQRTAAGEKAMAGRRLGLNVEGPEGGRLSRSFAREWEHPLHGIAERAPSEPPDPIHSTARSSDRAGTLPPGHASTCAATNPSHIGHSNGTVSTPTRFQESACAYLPCICQMPLPNRARPRLSHLSRLSGSSSCLEAVRLLSTLHSAQGQSRDPAHSPCA